MDLNYTMSNFTLLTKGFPSIWLEFLRNTFINASDDLPKIILVLSLICTVGAFLNLHLKDFPIPLPVILFLIGCSFEILSFTSEQVQAYADAIQWMSPKLVFDMFTPIIIFNVAFDMDVYMLQKLFWQILLITIPGFLMNYTFILWYLASANKLFLKNTPWLLFSAILVSSDPMLTAAAIRDLGLSRSLVNLINGESLMTSIMSLIIFSGIEEINVNLQKKNHSITLDILLELWFYFLASFLFGILSSKLIQLWMSTVFGEDVNHISLSSSILYFIFFICEIVGMSGIFTLAIMGLFLNSTSFKPGVEVLLLEFWNCLSFVAFLMVFTFIGLLIPAHTYLYVSFYDIYYSLNIYFTLIVLRLLVFLLLSPLLSRFGHGFSWRWAFIMVWSEMKGTPNINMALLLAYSDLSFGSEREKSQILFHGVSVCLVTLIVNRFILPIAVSKLGLHDVTSTKYKSLHCTFQHFQELTKSAASALKFDKDLANADWNMVEKAIRLQNPYALSQGDTTEHQKVKCLDCNREIDETLNIEAMELANRRLLSAQIASYQRQYRNETLSQSAAQVLVGAAGSFGEKKEKYMSPETIKHYSESKKLLAFIRKVLLNWVYNTKKEKGIPSRYYFLRVCHKIVFTDEFEYVGYLVTLMNMFPIIISWIPKLSDIYEHELRHSNYSFLVLYIMEALLKMAAMRKEYFLHAWNVFELVITLVGIIDIILIETNSITYTFDFILTVVFIKIVRFLRILRILKLITPKLLQIIDQKMSHQQSFQYAILKGYVQGEADIMTIIDQISTSKHVKQVLLRRITKNTGNAMKELGYLEYDHPEIAVTMKTKEEINVMLNLAREIVRVFKSKGIIHKIESTEINKLIMAKKKEILDFQPVIKPLTVVEALHHIPWLDKDKEYITFIQKRARIVTFDCGNDIFEEGDEPKGIYIIISGMVKTCFIPKNYLYEAFEQCSPHIEYKMWLKLGLSITAKKIREHLSYEDWNYKMQLKLCNVSVKDIPKNIKTGIYDETVIYVILIHGAVEDCQLRKAYKAPSLIPITCYQVQGTEDFTKVMIVQTSVDLKNFRWNTRKYVPSRKPSLPTSTTRLYKEGLQFETNIEIQQPSGLLDSIKEEMDFYTVT
ncbi:sodium/hydrogen exchanger 10 isoform X3 [Canis lupus familiaris]|uniref:Solute carrier family 9 member C1 n=2 Tax=Canis lupus familiaris TaxID=9615 RepID=A0A8I3QRU1_CANLF|nr:sodium/hydrogen exchanger 10 isoform X3 [Canis lupus familiaris]XP_035565913.2 sodium/hydrogen exchanger 10 isoform X4 [Canis lupus dingo]XP_038300840.1 sodium/hydrogen exchanger 10 isoform X3 [Canis lupus familiaris]XP_038438732.1 sodium/hydrogen exchanger 10 isoform X3 [Canis lupus familiaris]|eukprot:XP_013965619.1 sodium/hydrogen exchanger 10 isoform X3 [Canis lupus familiaris]